MNILIAIGILAMGCGLLYQNNVIAFLKYQNNPYNLQPLGACPVQIEQWIAPGEYLYFRARGNGIQLFILDSDNVTEHLYDPHHMLFNRAMQYGTDYQAGYLSDEDCIRIATIWINEYYTLKSESHD